MKLKRGLIKNISVKHPTLPRKDTVFGIRKLGRKLTNPMLCSIKTDRLIVPYVIKKNIVSRLATLSNVPKAKVSNANRAVKRIAVVGSPFLLIR